MDEDEDAEEKRRRMEAKIAAENFGAAVGFAADASALYARNLVAFLGLMVKDGALAVDLEDEILKASVVTHGGAVVHEGVKG